MRPERLRPFFHYYGSKYRLATRYPAPLFPRIIEPFAGSAAYSCLYYDRDVLLIDQNEDVRTIWNYLIHADAEEILDLPDIRTGQSIDDLDCSQPARVLIGYWLTKGTAHLNKVPGAWMRTGLYPFQFWGPYVRARIASQLKFIRHWKVVAADFGAAPLISDATYFVDPPYRGPKGRYYYGRDLDYGQLAIWCQSLSGHVLVCESQGADWLPFRSFHSTRGTAANRSEEVLYTQTPCGVIGFKDRGHLIRTPNPERRNPMARKKNTDADGGAGNGTATPATQAAKPARKRANPTDSLYWDEPRLIALIGLLNANPGRLTSAQVAQALSQHPAFADQAAQLAAGGTGIADKIRQQVVKLSEISVERGYPALVLRRASNSGVDRGTVLDKYFGEAKRIQAAPATPGQIGQVPQTLSPFTGTGLIPIPGAIPMGVGGFVAGD